MKLTRRQHFVAASLAYVYGAIIALLPFHAFLTTWAGSSFGYIDVFRVWKELLILLSVPLLLYLLTSVSELRRWFRADLVVRLAILYILLHLVVGGMAYWRGAVNVEALAYALLSNLRYVVFFVGLYMLAMLLPGIRTPILKAVGVSAAIVVVFGLLQAFVLPMQFLEHFGYGPSTIPAYQTIDNKPEFQRIQSTLRGANPLGAYLVIIYSLTICWTIYVWSQARLVKQPKQMYRQLVVAGLSVLSIVLVLFHSYSRAAYLGIVLATAIIVLVSVPPRLRRWLVIGGIVSVAVFGSVVYVLRDNDTVQNTIFHSDETSMSPESSNEKRAGALQAGVRDVVREPLGHGPGTAGPASFRNVSGPRIAENYYLQIGQEVGWLGLAFLITMTGVVARRLWSYRSDWLVCALLASLAGLVLVNMLSHAWADDTLGLLWWGVAGMTLGCRVMLRQIKATKLSK